MTHIPTWRRELIHANQRKAKLATCPCGQPILVGLDNDQHGDAILAWIVAGAAQYASGGLADPETVKVATADYAHNQDTVGRFLDDACIIGGGEQVKVKVAIVREAYETWCRTEGEQPVSAKSFGMALARKGVNSKRDMRSRFYLGITLLAESDDTNASSPGGDF